MVSLIIPIDDWNNNDRRKLFKRTVFSILTQSTDVEIVCIFGREIDKSIDEQIFGLFGDKIQRHVCTEKSKQLNFGIKAAKGDILGYVSPGTYLYPEKLLLQISALKNVPAWSFTGFTTMDNDKINYFMGEQYFGQFCDVQNQASMSDAIVNRFPNPCFINGDTTLFNRSMLDIVGSFDEKLTVIQNYDMWLRMAYVSQPYVVMQPLILQQLQESEDVEKRKKEEFKIVIEKVKNYAIGEY